MDKRQIEKAVNEYIGHPEEVGEGIDTYMRRKAFMDGANWRIDSLWHDASENPEMIIPNLDKNVDYEDTHGKIDL